MPVAQKPSYEDIESPRVWKASQSWFYEATYKMFLGDKTYKVKVRIRRNTYDAQSYAKVEVWSDLLLSWNLVKTLPMTPDLTSYAISHIDMDVKPYQFFADEHRLLSIAEAILEEA